MKMICPKCKSDSVDVHPINLTLYHWYLCMDCSYVWNETGYDEWWGKTHKDGERRESE